jgi:acyl dehydratase
MATAEGDRQLLSHGKITDEGVDRLRALINQEMRPSYRFNLDVTRDGVQHFANGVGDGNELWTDPERATSLYGAGVAPPSFLYTIHPTFVQVGLPGVHGFHAGTDWRWFRPLLHGDSPRTTTWIYDIVEKEGRMGGRQVLAYYRTVYSTKDNEVIADCLTCSMRVERDSSRKNNKHKGWEPAQWESETLLDLEEQMMAEEVRGAEDRYWDDVEVGEAVGPILKGPLNLSDMIAWYVGSQPLYAPAHELAIAHFRKHPKWGYRNAESGAKESGIRVHEDSKAAKSAGVPAQYDLGVQRNQWLVQLLTNWCGDSGFVRECDAEYRAFNFFGDVQWLKGEVTGKKVGDDGEHLVELEVHAENQRGQTTMPGKAVIELPTRDGSFKPVEMRLTTSIDHDAYLAEVVPELRPLA